MTKKLTRSLLVMTLFLGLFFQLLPIQALATETQKEATLLQKIKDRGKLILGTSADYPPFEFIMTKDGVDQPVGIDMSVGQKLADELGVELEIVDMQFDSLLPALEAGSVDVLIAGMTYTEERDKSVDFSKPYILGGQAMAIRKSDEGKYNSKDDFQGLTVGTQQGTFQEELLDQQVLGAKKYAIGRIPDLIIALTGNQIDGIVLETEIAEANAMMNPQIMVIDPGFEVDDSRLGKRIVTQQNEPELMAVIEQTIDKIEAEGLMDVYSNQAYTDLRESQGESNSIFSYWSYFAKGIGMTLIISLIAIVVGCVIGFFIALMRLSNIGALKYIAMAYTEFLRGTPLMIQVMFIYLGLGTVMDTTPFVAGAIGVALNSGAYISEIIRSGLQSVDKGQTEAARSLGLSESITMKRIILPQALQIIWPALGNEFITLIKESSIVSVIGVADLMYQTRVVTSLSYKGIATLLVAMVIYFVITFSLSKLLNIYEKKMRLRS